MLVGRWPDELTPLHLQALFDAAAPDLEPRDHQRSAGLRQRAVPCRPARRCRTPSASRTRPARRRSRPRSASSRRSTTILNPRTFRLGDIQLGDIKHQRARRPCHFQGDFDLRQLDGLHPARLGGHRHHDAHRDAGCCRPSIRRPARCCRTPRAACSRPNDAQGSGLRVRLATPCSRRFGAATGAQIDALGARDPSTPRRRSTRRDQSRRRSTRRRRRPRSLPRRDRRRRRTTTCSWTATDDLGGSGVKHTTVYVSVDGGDWQIWLRQSTATQAVLPGRGRAQRTSSSRCPPTTPATASGRRSARRPAGRRLARRTSAARPTWGSTTQDIGEPPAPSAAPSTNPLFTQAETRRAGDRSDVGPRSSTRCSRRLSARVFGTGIAQSYAGIGPLALLATPDGNFIASGGANRGALYAFDQDGGNARSIRSSRSTSRSSTSRTTRTAAVGHHRRRRTARARSDHVRRSCNRYGDSLTQALAVDPATGVLYVSSGDGIEIFDPVTRTFRHFSDVRVDDLAFAPDGALWGTSWPTRGDVVKFDAKGRAQAQVRLDADVDSIAFGQAGTQLEGLLFIWHARRGRTTRRREPVHGRPRHAAPRRSRHGRAGRGDAARHRRRPPAGGQLRAEST